MHLQTKRKLHRFAAFVFSLILLFSLFAITVSAENLGSHPLLLEKSSVIETALKTAFAQKADALVSEATTLEDENAAAQKESTAAALRALSLNPYRLAIVEYAYEQHYIGEYRSVSSLANEITDCLVENFYIDRLNNKTDTTDALIYSYMYAIGDKYASYYNEETYADYMSDSNASYSGIGVTVTPLETGYVEVIGITPDSPAEKGGMALGDIIVAVDGEDFAELGYTAAVNRIRGETGTNVTVTVLRGENRIDFTLTRAELTEYTVTSKILQGGDGKIGYIHISQFDTGTFGQFRDAVCALGEQGAEKYVFDVRNNPGGMLDSVLAVLDYILPDGTGKPLVRIQYKNATQEFHSITDYIKGNTALELRYEAATDHQIDAPIAVLCNEYTASAGELFTSCLKDFGAAEVFGTATYGKGTGQQGYLLTDFYAFNDIDRSSYSFYVEALFNLSSFYYAPPVSDNYEGVGVMPHHVVTLSEEAQKINFYKLTEEQDDQLAAAIESLNGKAGVPFDPSKEQNNDPAQNAMQFFFSDPFLWTVFAVLLVITGSLVAFLIVSQRKAKRKEQEMLIAFAEMRTRKTEAENEPSQDPPSDPSL